MSRSSNRVLAKDFPANFWVCPLDIVIERFTDVVEHTALERDLSGSAPTCFAIDSAM
jgi:hypothetical protein